MEEYGFKYNLTWLHFRLQDLHFSLGNFMFNFKMWVLVLRCNGEQIFDIVVQE